MPFPIASKTGEQIEVTVFGEFTAPGGDVTRVDLTGITVTVDSGDGTFVVAEPPAVAFTAKAGAEGETVYGVTGTQAGGPDLTDTVVYTVTGGAVPGTVATALGFEAGPAEPQDTATPHRSKKG